MKRIWGWLKSVVTTFLSNNCSMHAAGLTYFALLAVMPVLCCVLVSAKACGVDRYAREQINRRIDAMIEEVEKGPDNEQLSRLPIFDTVADRKKRIAAEEFGREARKISNELFGRVENFDVGTLGWIGFGFLLWTVISSLASVEDSFNAIFNVEKSRPIWKRAYLYLFIMIAMPILATLAMSLPVMNVAKGIVVATLGASWLTRWAGDGLVMLLDSWCFRFVVTFAASSFFFAFFYWMIPNRRIGVRAAFGGGMITALVFGSWLKICAFAQVGIAKSSALYGSFAFLPIVLAWLYISWQIVLLGACMVRSFEGQK